MLYLQNRWKLIDNKIIYYGIRKRPNLLKNIIKLSKRERKVIRSLPRDLKDE